MAKINITYNTGEIIRTIDQFDVQDLLVKPHLL